MPRQEPTSGSRKPKGGGKKDVRVVSDLVTGDIPVRDEGVISVREGGVISHSGPTSIGVSTLGEELVDGIQGVRLDGIVGRKHDELRNICLRNRSVSATKRECINSHRRNDGASEHSQDPSRQVAWD